MVDLMDRHWMTAPQVMVQHCKTCSSDHACSYAASCSAAHDQVAEVEHLYKADQARAVGEASVMLAPALEIVRGPTTSKSADVDAVAVAGHVLEHVLAAEASTSQVYPSAPSKRLEGCSTLQRQAGQV